MASDEVVEEDDLIGVCTECHTDIPDSYMKKNAHFLEGLGASCPYCGGVVSLTYRSIRDSALKTSDMRRGLS